MKETRKYKQTELGLLPEDWDVAKLGDIGELAMCKRIFQNETSEMGDVPFYKIGTFGKTADAYISYAKYNEFKSAYRFPNKGDILISAAGTIGRIVVYDGEPAYFQDSNIVWLAHSGKTVSNDFLYYVYQITDWNTENTTIARLYNDNFNKTIIPLPPIEEQRCIASALTGIDNLIDSLDRLIAKKRDIKQGAMQQLLSGKKRLKGFTEPWVEKKLGDLASQKSYGVGAESIGYNGVDKYIRITDITDDGTYLPTPLSSPSFYQSCHIVGENDLLIARTGASVGKTYLYNPSDGRLIFAGFLMKIQIVNAVSLFVFYLTQTTLFKQWVVSESMRSGQPGINLQQISSWTFPAPSLPEQQAIAAVLTSMDNELSALEAKRKKYEQIKQGMMQQLLTGKIRLIS